MFLFLRLKTVDFVLKEVNKLVVRLEQVANSLADEEDKIVDDQRALNEKLALVSAEKERARRVAAKFKELVD